MNKDSIGPAVAAYNDGIDRDKYTSEEWTVIGESLVQSANELVADGYRLEGDQILAPHADADDPADPEDKEDAEEETDDKPVDQETPDAKDKDASPDETPEPDKEADDKPAPDRNLPDDEDADEGALEREEDEAESEARKDDAEPEDKDDEEEAEAEVPVDAAEDTDSDKAKDGDKDDDADADGDDDEDGDGDEDDEEDDDDSESAEDAKSTPADPEAPAQDATTREFADPKNKKWPLDKAHIQPAIDYYNAGAGQDKHSAEEWHLMGERIVRAANQHLGAGYSLKDGKVHTPHMTEAGDGAPVSSQTPVEAAPVADKAETPEEENTDHSTPTAEEKAEEAAADADGWTVELEAYTTDSNEIVWEALSDAEKKEKKGLLRVRQKATCVDALNGNNRIYPRSVMRDAIARAREHAEAGAMLSELLHPKVAEVDGEEIYVDNHDRKTARVDTITEPGPDGWVWIERTILNTPEGRRVAKRIKDGKALGISTRFKMRGHRSVVDGKNVHVADEMEIHTWDDVPNPAFADAGQFELLSDSLLVELGLETLTDAVPSTPEAEDGQAAPQDAVDAVGDHAMPPEQDAAGEADAKAEEDRPEEEEAADVEAEAPHPGEPGEDALVWQEESANRQVPHIGPTAYAEFAIERDSAQRWQFGTRKFVGLEFARKFASDALTQTLHRDTDPADRPEPTPVSTDSTQAEPQVTSIPDPTSDGTTLPATTSDRAPVEAASRRTSVNETIQRALNDLQAGILTGATKDEIVALRQAVSDAIKAAKDAGEDLSEAFVKVLAVDEKMALMGYNGDRHAPSATKGNETGSPSDPGFAPDVRERAPGYVQCPEAQKSETAAPSRPAESGLMKNDSGLSDDEIAILKARIDAERREKAESERAAQIAQAVEDARAATNLDKLPTEHQEYIIASVKAAAKDAAEVETLMQAQLDHFGALIAKERLRGGGYAPEASAKGQTVADVSHPAYVKSEAKPWMSHVDRLCAAADSYRRSTEGFDATASDVLKLRKYNRERFIEPLIDDMAARFHSSKTAQEWFAKEDSLMNKGEQALCDAIEKASTASDMVTTSNLFNQPTISTALLIQQFQDMEALQFVHGIGPSLDMGAGLGGFELTGNSGDGRVGSVLRIPVEYYTAPSGWGTYAGPQFDAGLLTPEGSGIDEAQINTIWLPFAPAWRRIAISLTRDAIRAMGNGPLNYPAVARALFHIGYAKGRTMDKALLDEMLQISDEYNAVAVTSENVNLANNTAYNGSGNIVVNLNTTKAASATVAAGDASVTYGANAVAAIRIQAGGNGSSSPYAGTANGMTPIVRPRNKVDLNAAGQVTTTTVNAFGISAPANAVEGYIDANGNVATKPGGGSTANFAVDYNNGVVILTSSFPGSLAGSGGVITAPTTITMSYSYVTNYDSFNVTNPSLATGETPSAYFNRLLAQMDSTAAKMGSAPRFVKPNLALMSLNASTFITQATIFYKLNSPDGTNLFPTENYFFERTGIKGARLNSPWFAQDTRILLTRLGSTKYAIDTPFEIRGPYPKYDSNGKIVAGEVYYGEENSVVATPQVQDGNGKILNPVARTILLR